MIKHDYKPQNSKRFYKPGFFERLPVWATHPYMIFSMAALIMMLAIFLSKDNEQSSTSSTEETLIVSEFDSGEISIQSPTNPKETSSQYNPELTIEHSINEQFSSPIEIPLDFSAINKTEVDPIQQEYEQQWRSEAVKKGDNLSLIFKRIGLTPQILYKVVSLDKNTKKLKNLKPGEILQYQLDKNKQLIALKYIIDPQNTLYVNKISSANAQGLTLKSKIVNKTIELRTAYISGTITDSLFLSGKRAGLSDTLVINLANIFDWDIDFILDIRVGDTFSVLYQEKFLDGEKIANGDIIAAEFVNQGDSYKAIRYTDSKNISSYYTPKGLSMRKAFLRAPIKFSYISSGFKLRRFHPIQKRWKAHRGIDYRANTGTPIRAAGDGKILQSSYNKYNGKYVFIQHGQGIVTKYLHMSKRAVSRGKRVKQGQVIGYVGTTGMSEAPHLHYEFVVNGVHRNPRTVKLPQAEPISKKEKSNFLVASETLVNQLESRKHIQSANQVAH